MKKVMFVAVFFSAMASGSAFAAATTACNGSTAGAKTYQLTGATGNYVQQDFTARCSNNVNLSFEQNQYKLGVSASSIKGKTMFSGGSGGGGVTGSPCANGNCTTGDTDTAANAIFTSTSS